MDFVSGLPPSDGNIVVLVLVDRFTKTAHFVPLPQLPSAPQTANIELREVVKHHGPLVGILSNREPQFIAHFWKQPGVSVGLTSWCRPNPMSRRNRLTRSWWNIYTVIVPPILHPGSTLGRISSQSAHRVWYGDVSALLFIVCACVSVTIQLNCSFWAWSVQYQCTGKVDRQTFEGLVGRGLLERLWVWTVGFVTSSSGLSLLTCSGWRSSEISEEPADLSSPAQHRVTHPTTSTCQSLPALGGTVIVFKDMVSRGIKAPAYHPQRAAACSTNGRDYVSLRHITQTKRKCTETNFIHLERIINHVDRNQPTIVREISCCSSYCASYIHFNLTTVCTFYKWHNTVVNVWGFLAFCWKWGWFLEISFYI